MSLPVCPKLLPADLALLVEKFGETWAASSIRPSPKPEILNHWATLVRSWASDPELPLLVRKHRNNRGSQIIHLSGRILIPSDNSAAHWAFTLASEGIRPTLDQIRSWFEQDKIPVVMIQKSAEKITATHHCRLPKTHNVNIKGWKLAHIKPAGLKTRTEMASIPIEDLKAKFINFISPENMFVVPIEWSGIAEADSVIKAIENWQNSRPA